MQQKHHLRFSKGGAKVEVILSPARDKCRLFCRLCRIIVAFVAFKEKNKKNTSLRGIL